MKGSRDTTCCKKAELCSPITHESMGTCINKDNNDCGTQDNTCFGQVYKRQLNFFQTKLSWLPLIIIEKDITSEECHLQN